jgi:hypothetical protein
MNRIINFLLGIVCGLAVCSISLYIWSTHKMTKVHTLKQPLILSSNAPGKVLHLLPVGATLYLDKSFPEGFTRYKIYVNVDRMPLALRELVDPSEIDPLEARAFDKQALAQALREYPLTRDELAAILQSPQLTKQDVQEVLAEYLEKNK